LDIATTKAAKTTQVRHIIRRLYDAENDFNCFGRAPVGTYMLATLPRSGSTFCAIRLWQTGLLGAPMEYLNFRIMGDLLKRLGYCPDRSGHIDSHQVRAYWSDVQRLRTSPNGMFSYKMFASIYREISKTHPDFLNELSPHYVVYLTRRDAVGQAISYSRAQRSRAWFSGMHNAPAVDYDYKHIRECLRSIEEQKCFWEKAFQITGAEPIRIFYEDLLDPATDVASFVLRTMGIKPCHESAIPVPMIMRQTDGISKEWRDRFLQDCCKDEEASAVK
jgi:LPS sulfotransferase NodH